MKINFEGERATSVQVENNFKEVVTITARKGIILAAGAVFSPQLLQVSGIGDPALLRRLGVQEVAPNPDVGQNFVDRNMVNFGSLAGFPVNLSMALEFIRPSKELWAENFLENPTLNPNPYPKH